MKLDPVNLLGGYYQDNNLPWSAQDVCNWIPRPAEQAGTISPLKLAGAPGMLYRGEIDEAPVRIGGMRNVEGKLFVVAGTTLYEVSSDYVATARGTIPGVGPVSMSHNQLEFGNELTVVNGDAGYVWNTFTSAFTQINDDAFPGSVQVDYLNRRMIHTDPFGRFLFPSEVDSATEFDSLDRSDSEVSPDKFVGQGVNQFELVGFSQRTIEWYSDTGATEQPFRPKRIALQTGCASRTSIVNLDNSLMFLGNDGIFYRLNGYGEVAISTGPINKAIQGLNWSQCFGSVWEDRQHKVAYWTFPDGKTWGYDAWTKLWHRRESFGLNRWRLNALAEFNGKWIGGDFQRGRLYELDWDTFHEAGKPLIAMRSAPPIYNNGNTVVCPLLELAFDTGRGGLPDLSSLGQIALSGELLGGLIGSPYSSGPLNVLNGVAPYTWSASALPDGLSIDPFTGVVAGTPTESGSFEPTVRVSDQFGRTASLPCSVVIDFSVALVSHASAGNLLIRSGADPTFPIQQTIPTVANPNNWATTADGEYVAIALSGAPFIRLWRRQSNGVYVELVSALSHSPTVNYEGICFSSDGEYLVINQSSAMWMFKKDAGGDTFTRVVNQAIANVAFTFKFSPDDSKLAAALSTTVHVFNRSGDTLTEIGTGILTISGGSVAWTHDGTRIGLSVSGGLARVYQVTSSALTGLGTASTNCPLGRCVWSLDNQFFYIRPVTSPFLQIYQWTGSALVDLGSPAVVPSSSSYDIDISVDGRLLVVGDLTNGLRVYEVQSDGSLTLTSTVTGSQESARFLESIDFAVTS